MSTKFLEERFTDARHLLQLTERLVTPVQLSVLVDQVGGLGPDGR